MSLSAIGNGRKVRCTKCKYIWMQYPNKSDQKKKVSAKKVSLARSLPVVIEYVVPGWLKALPAVFMCLILVTSIFFFHEDIAEKYKSARTMYEKIGIFDLNNVEIQKIELSKKDDNSLDINGFVVNNSGEMKRVPNVIVRVVNSANKKIASFKIKLPRSGIGKNAKYPFFKNIKNLPKDAKLITLELEDKIDKLYG